MIFRSCLLSIVDFVVVVSLLLYLLLLLCCYVVLVSSRQLTVGAEGKRKEGREGVGSSALARRPLDTIHSLKLSTEYRPIFAQFAIAVAVGVGVVDSVAFAVAVVVAVAVAVTRCETGLAHTFAHTQNNRARRPRRRTTPNGILSYFTASVSSK